jgi:class 3 adenylate cyclase
VDDFDALEGAAIANARERAGLIKYLDSLGFTVEEMVEAESRGRLFGLAGDVLHWSGRPTYSIRTAAAAVNLVGHPKAREAGLQVRAGLGYGEALAINGDYFGTTVNLAARLVGAAKPRQILASQAVRDELPSWAATAPRTC